MNKQTQGAGIEWTQIYGRDGYTWNPIAGCFHDCQWEMPDGTIAECYAKTIANGVAKSAYTNGFEHHYWNPHKLDEPLKLKKGAGIFVDSMSDMFGHWVADDQIQQVLDVCRDASQHIFFVLTKNAVRLPKFEFPPNVFVGASSPPDHFKGKWLLYSQRRKMLQVSLKALSDTNASVKWISFEPLSQDYSQLLDTYPNIIQWAVIGAASQGKQYFAPDKTHFQNMLAVLDDQKVPVFFKGNMKCLPEAVNDWREDFPEQTGQWLATNVVQL